MLNWISEEREAAILLHQVLQAEHVEYFILRRYRLSLEHEQAKKDPLIRQTQSEAQAVRMARQEPDAWLGHASKLRRTDVNDRKSVDDVESKMGITFRDKPDRTRLG